MTGKGGEIERLINVRAINKHIGDNSVVNLVCGHKKVVIRATHINKGDNIQISDEAQSYLFSKFRDVY